MPSLSAADGLDFTTRRCKNSAELSLRQGSGQQHTMHIRSHVERDSRRAMGLYDCGLSLSVV